MKCEMLPNNRRKMRTSLLEMNLTMILKKKKEKKRFESGKHWGQKKIGPTGINHREIKRSST